MAIVAEYKFEHGSAKIDDTYCRDKTQHEIDEILKRIGQIAYRIDLRKACEKLKEQRGA